jgi:hypothetical protein
MKERRFFDNTEGTPALAVDHKPSMTLVIVYLVMALLFAGREVNGNSEATRLASTLLQSNDQATLAGAELESNELTSVTTQKTESTPTTAAVATKMIPGTSDTGTPDSFLRTLPCFNGQRSALAGGTVQAAISDGYFDPGWLDYPHPRIRSDDRHFGPGSHRGISPTARGPTVEFKSTIGRRTELK